jgi:hypothetical protein
MQSQSVFEGQQSKFALTMQEPNAVQFLVELVAKCAETESLQGSFIDMMINLSYFASEYIVEKIVKAGGLSLILESETTLDQIWALQNVTAKLKSYKTEVYFEKDFLARVLTFLKSQRELTSSLITQIFLLHESVCSSLQIAQFDKVLPFLQETRNLYQYLHEQDVEQ